MSLLSSLPLSNGRPLPGFNLDGLILAIGLLVTALLYTARRRRSPFANFPLPPGPRRLPIIGNVLDIPKAQEWLVYQGWSKKFGSDLVHMDLFGTHMIIVNSAKAAHELFEKRSAIYSDRHRRCRLKLEWVLAFTPYGQRWRDVRKEFHEHFRQAAVVQYRPVEVKATHRLLARMLQKPNDFMDHLRHMAGEIILNIAYGIDVKPHGDPYVDTAEKALQSFAWGSTFGMMFDYVPALLHIPDWFPGAGFKKHAQQWIAVNLAVVEAPFRFVKDALAKGTAAPSIATTALTQLHPHSDETLPQHVLGNMYIGASTVSSLGTFFLAMACYPEAMRKAQAELDTVIGKDRLPEFADMESLPYVSALVKEILRWRPVGPLAVPHRVTSDDVYEGYYIPAGSIVMGSAWSILHDEETYPDAAAFKPEHFLGEGAVEFPEYAFGFGRRVCPGRFLARASLWITIACLLHTFHVEKKRDENGQIVEPVDFYSSGILSYPAPFEVSIKPRSESAVNLIRAVNL
ncbi:cytochrome P450 [Dentipellis sp. KUC8613]|nr:cytochrome P450 [Dentipellis sp. KUC8613]